MKLGTILTMVVLMVTGSALADWDIGDPHKMHFPQLPKVDGGWDVMASYYVVLADDWKCSETGYVNDIHTWVSFKGDDLIELTTVHLAIWSDDPEGDTGITGEDSDNTFSKPLERLWHGDTGTWAMQLWDTGDQGWFDARDPDDGTKVLPTEPDHINVYQMNFLFDDAEAFLQVKDTIYWLEFTIQDPTEVTIGWKESADNWNDDAVWRIEANHDWNELIDPETGTSMDLAFVITPEPATLSLLAIGGLALIRRRRK